MRTFLNKTRKADGGRQMADGRRQMADVNTDGEADGGTGGDAATVNHLPSTLYLLPSTICLTV
jgi:hypothetical protein